MPRVEKCPAEELRIASGIVSNASLARRAIIGCVGCKWKKRQRAGDEPRVYGLEIARCSGLKPGTVYPTLQKLHAAGFANAVPEEIDPHTEGRPPRTYYVPSDTKLGQEFEDSLEEPEICDLEP